VSLESASAADGAVGLLTGARLAAERLPVSWPSLASWPNSSSPRQKLAAHTTPAHHPRWVTSWKFQTQLGDFIINILFEILSTTAWVYWVVAVMTIYPRSEATRASGASRE